MPDPSPGARLRERAERARRELREAAERGDPDARRALRDLGEPAPVPRHWSERDEAEGEDGP